MSDPPSYRPPKHINVDATGVSMSWRTALVILGTVVAGVLAWTTFTATLARSSDLSDHNRAETAHPALQEELRSTIAPLRDKVNKTATAVDEVRDGFHESRAEDLAYRAVETMPVSTKPRERIKRFNDVKKQAVENLQSGKDIRTDIKEPLL